MQNGYRHRYNIGEFLLVFAQAYRAGFRMAVDMLGKKGIDKHFRERIMLAVTEVNGCEICSYAHTQMALKQGLDSEEISALLQGDKDAIRPEEAKAILFAQHYADSNGKPDKGAYEALLAEYGEKKTRSIMAAIQVMMMGNVTGLPMSALRARIKKHPYHNSTIWYELCISPAFIYMFPIAMLMALFLWIPYPKNIVFAKSEEEETS